MSTFDPFAARVPVSNINYDSINSNLNQIATRDKYSVPLQTQQLVKHEIATQKKDWIKPDENQGEEEQQGGRAPPQLYRSKSLRKNIEIEDSLSLYGRKKYNSSRSISSADSSRSTASGYSQRNSPLDDPAYAPAPIIPSGLRNTNQLFNMPSFDMVTHSGHAMARTSLKSLVMKKWRPIFWISYGDSRIFVFRSKTDFEEWVTNPHLSAVERDALVKIDVDFKHFKKKPGVRGYRVSSLHLKDYGGKSGLLYTFKLEEWFNYGPIILGAFASKNRIDVRSFLVIVKEMMRKNKQNLSGYKLSTESQYSSDRSNRSIRSAPQLKNGTSGPGSYSRSGNHDQHIPHSKTYQS